MKDHQAIEWLSGQLPGLVESGVITPETAAAVRDHYQGRGAERSHGIAVVVCAILGATLVGAGIILLIAHNWDDLGRPARTVFSFLPLVLASVLSVVALARKQTSLALNESAGAFHMLSIGAAISLVSQTYHIDGDFSGFILTWALLALPLAYLLRSTMVAIFYLAGITVWAWCRFFESAEMPWFWGLFAAGLPFYAWLLWKDRFSIRAGWLAACIAIAAGFGLGLQCSSILIEAWLPAFGGFFTVLYLIERLWLRKDGTSRFAHPFRIIGAWGIVVLCIVMTFKVMWGWENSLATPPSHTPFLVGRLLLAYWGIGGGLLLATIVLLVLGWRSKKDFNMVAGVFPLVILAALVSDTPGNGLPAALLMNGYAALLGIGTIVRGFLEDRGATLNAGMVIAGALIIARFFDSDLSIIARAVAFILIGAGFIASNWLLVSRRRQEVRI